MLMACVPINAQPQADRLAEMQARGAALLQRLTRGEPVKIVAFGDSLAAGWGTDGRHVYHRLVADTLRYRFFNCPLELVVHGHPGETTGDALRRVAFEVVAEKPDLLLVQFGGNDKGWGRSVQAYRRDLGRLLGTVRDQTGALVIACLAPIDAPDPANPWSETARAVAKQEGIPAADLDRAIREGDPDFRGSFAYEGHPGGFTHLIMAREILRALDQAMGQEPVVECRFEVGPKLLTGDKHSVRAVIRNLSRTDIQCVTQIEEGGKATEETIDLEKGAQAPVSREVALPRPAGGRSYAFPVRLLARALGAADLDVSWLTVAPAVAADKAAEDGKQPETPAWHKLGQDCFTLGKERWLGPHDLAAAFAVVAYPDRLQFIINVTDDDLATAGLTDPSRGDSVELYLDLRPDEDQGKPVYSVEVLALQVIPPARPQGRTRWRSMQPLPGDLKGIAARSQRTNEGYRVELDLPLEPVIARRGDEWGGFGFDVGVNDADFGGIRESQLMWAGIPDNYINPAYLAGLYPGPVPEGATRRTLQ